jgi:hypothetical protein
VFEKAGKKYVASRTRATTIHPDHALADPYRNLNFRVAFRAKCK